MDLVSLLYRQERISNDPIVNKPGWFLLMRQEQSEYGFIVGFKCTVDENTGISVKGVNRARITNRRVSDGLLLCSGTVLSDE